MINFAKWIALVLSLPIIVLMELWSLFKASGLSFGDPTEALDNMKNDRKEQAQKTKKSKSKKTKKKSKEIKDEIIIQD